MSYLEYRTGLQGLYACDMLPSTMIPGRTFGTSGDPGYWPDMSGNSTPLDHLNDILAGAGAAAPVLSGTVKLGGRYVVTFSGGQKFTGPNITSFLAANVATWFVLFMPTAVTANSGTIQVNDGLIGGSASNSPAIVLRNNGPNAYAFVNDAAGPLSTPKAIALNRWYVAIWTRTGTTLTLLIDDSFDGSSNVAGTNPVNGTASPLKVGENHNATAWFTGHIAEILLYNTAIQTDDRQHIVNYLANKYLSPSIDSSACSIIRGDPHAQGIDVGSRRQWEFRRGRQKASIVVPIEYGDIELMTDIGIVHKRWPSSDGLGSGNLPWAVGTARPELWSMDLDNQVMRMVVHDTRDAMYNLRLTGRLVGSYTPRLNGLARLAGAAYEVFTRQSNAWIADFSDGRFIQINPEAQKVEVNGRLFEGVDKNILKRSSFVSGFTGITQSAGSGTLGLDTSLPLMFDPAVTPNGAKLHANSPHTTETKLTWPTATVERSVGRVTIYHRDLDGTALSWRLQKSSDSKWWRDSDATWQVAQTDNALPVTPTASTIVKDKSKQLTGLTLAETLTLVFVIPTTIANASNIIYHAEIRNVASGTGVGLKWSGTPIVTDASVYTTADDTLRFIATEGNMLEEAGTMLAEIVMPCDSADISNMELGSGLFSFGTTSVNFSGAGGLATSSLVAGTTYRIAGRWIGVNQELRLARRTRDVFLNGVKGVSGVAGGDQTSTTLTLGNGANTPYIKQLLVVPFAMTNEEIAAWGA